LRAPNVIPSRVIRMYCQRYGLKNPPMTWRSIFATLSLVTRVKIAWDLAHGRVVVDEGFGPWPLWLRTAASAPDLEVLPLTVDVAIDSEQLGDSFPQDPADRLIAATARVHDLTLITSDRPMQRSAVVRRVW